MSLRRLLSSTQRAGSPLELSINGIRVVFRYCPPGTFLMGDPSQDASPREVQHKVTLSNGFWLLETPVTQALWKAIMRNNPSEFQSDNHPVGGVSWYDCHKFIDKLNSYGYFFDFPTEAEWEYACRAGTTTPYNFGFRFTGVEANCAKSYPYGTTSPVRYYSPNAWNLYDMHGNVYEWCKDWFGGNICKWDKEWDEAWYIQFGRDPSAPVTDPSGPQKGTSRILRGGSWYGSSATCNTSFHRFYAPPESASQDIGFRLALRAAD